METALPPSASNNVNRLCSSYRPEWPTNASAYEILSKVGQGAFATVYRARVVEASHRFDGSVNEVLERCPADSAHLPHVAVKILDLEGLNANLVEIQQEVHTMRLSMHENVLTCHTSFVHESQLWLVTQLMEKGSCLHCMADSRKKFGYRGMREHHLAYVLHETLRGLKYFHDSGQIHRDIKAGNILLNSDGNVRIADFGVSGWLVRGGDRRYNTKTFVGTPCWMAPEVMEQVDGYDYKADIWSLGITALELAKSFPPYAHFSPMKVLLLTIQEDPPTLETYDAFDNDATNDAENGSWSRTFADFFRVCLQKDPNRRPTCSQLLNHKLIRDLSDTKIREKRRLQFKAELCAHVEDVGGNTQSARRLPGTCPVTIARRPAGLVFVLWI
mmetsp:Transcript_8412/g.18443  ORF Transcript_8412/g.18443 Transcript_8412/m.18443 type:complete len:387 (-) Transcript_8412:1121-2281(-)